MGNVNADIKEVGYEDMWTGFKWFRIGPSSGLF
jgi:hypothetical protein